MALAGQLDDHCRVPGVEKREVLRGTDRAQQARQSQEGADVEEDEKELEEASTLRREAIGQGKDELRGRAVDGGDGLVVDGRIDVGAIGDQARVVRRIDERVQPEVEYLAFPYIAVQVGADERVRVPEGQAEPNREGQDQRQRY